MKTISVIPGPAQRVRAKRGPMAGSGRNPESGGNFRVDIRIPDRRHSASKTRVNALMAASGMTGEFTAATT
jgi:hypothetical protein